MGSLVLTDESDGEGRVRFFVLDPALRGNGLGRRLIGELVEHARRGGYDRLALCTFSALTVAARLYRELGFAVASEKRGPRWGRDDVVYQEYELSLRSSASPTPAARAGRARASAPSR